MNAITVSELDGEANALKKGNTIMKFKCGIVRQVARENICNTVKNKIGNTYSKARKDQLELKKIDSLSSQDIFDDHSDDEPEMSEKDEKEKEIQKLQSMKEDIFQKLMVRRHQRAKRQVATGRKPGDKNQQQILDLINRSSTGEYFYRKRSDLEKNHS